MVTYKAGVEFGTNVGVLSRDMATAAQVTKVFGTEAATSLKQATVAQDEYVLAAQKVLAADARLAASKERLIALQATGKASTRELAAAQSAFVVSQERQLTATAAQAKLIRDAQVAAASASTTGTTGRAGGLGVVGVIGGLAATEVAIKVKDAIEAGARSAAGLQAINRQIDSTLQSTGNAAQTSVTGIDTMSEHVSRLTGISEEATRGGALLELTFTGIRNEGDGAAAVFDRAQQTAANMAIGLSLAKGGAIDYQGAMQQLARALNDPVAGMTLLTRSGVSFTASQKEQIKTLAQSGQTLQAQELILSLVNQKYADATRNYANTAAGAYAQVRESLSELERKLASPILSAGVPALHELRDFIDFLSSHPQGLELGEVAVGLTGVAFAVATVEKAFAFMSESKLAAPLLRMLFPLRSAQRALGILATEEDAAAASSTRATVATDALAASYERTAVAAGAAADAQGAAAVAAGAAAASGAAASGEAAAAGGLSGLLARFASSPGIGIRAGSLAAGATVAAGLIDPVILASLLAGSDGDPKGLDAAMAQQNDLVKGFAKKGNGFYAGRFQITDPQTEAVLTLLGGQVKGGTNLTDPQLRAFAQAHPNLYNYNAGGQTSTTKAQNTALMQVLALAATTAVQGTGGLPNVSTTQLSTEQSLIGGTLPGLTDAPSTVRADRLASVATADRAVQAAQRRYAAAQRAVSTIGGAHVDPNKVTAAQDRLVASEDRLVQIRLKRGTTDAQIASAEAAIATARARLTALNDTGTASTTRLAAAEDRLKNAHDGLLAAQDRQTKAAQTAHAGGALSASQVGARFAQNLQHAQDLDAAQRSLANQGLSQGVLEQLDLLEKQAPGTLQRVARSLTPAMVKALNREYSAMQKTQQDFLVIPFQAAAIYAAKQHAKTLQDLAAADLAAFGRYFSWGPKGAQLPGVGSNAGTIGHPVGDNGQPIGVRAGTTTGGVGANVTVHVHTAAPSYRVSNSMTVNVDHMTAKDVAALEARRRRAVWN